jgi:hypothetical protein
MSKKNLINQVNDILKMNIICAKKEETKECSSILEKLLGFCIVRKIKLKNKYLIVLKNCFANKYTNNKNISFYDFKKETKKFLKPTIKTEYNEKAMIEYIKNNKVAIHCPNEEDYDKLINMLDKNGEKWCDGDIFSKENIYYDYKDESCISYFLFNEFGYGDISFYKNGLSYKILTVKELFDKFKIEKKEELQSEYLTTHQQLLDNVGKRVSCYINGKFIEDGKIQEEGFYVKEFIHICQNQVEGSNCKDKLGYKHSWLISISNNKYENNNNECKKIKLLEDKPVEDIEYDKNTGRIIKINNYKCNNSIYIVSDGFFRNTKRINEYTRDYLDFIFYIGMAYISQECCAKAEKKMIEQVKLENSKL